jgi:hypothetical protein
MPDFSRDRVASWQTKWQGQVLLSRGANMDILTFMLLGFGWTLIAFSAGILVHWWATRKQRRLLKMYRGREQARRHASMPIE